MSFLSALSSQQRLAFSNHWRRFMYFGILLTLVGLLAISTAAWTTVVTVVFLGVLLLISGVIIVLDTLGAWWGKWSTFFFHFIVGLLYLFAGFYLAKHPIEGSMSLTYLLGIFYLFMGCFRLMLSFSIKLPQWGWGFFNGLITVLIGALILSSWPASSLMIIGLFVGLDFLFTGISYIMMAMAAKKFAQTVI